jgi:hypothetical protein
VPQWEVQSAYRYRSRGPLCAGSGFVPVYVERNIQKIVHAHVNESSTVTGFVHVQMSKVGTHCDFFCVNGKLF